MPEGTHQVSTLGENATSQQTQEGSLSNLDAEKSEKKESEVNLHPQGSTEASQVKRKKKRGLTRKVADYTVYVEEVLGIGQYGKVCKAQKTKDSKAKSDLYFACKIIDITNISQTDMQGIEKEVSLHDRIDSDQCVRLFQTIKTQSNIYMMMEYCNGSDLACLLKMRKQLS